MSEIGGVRSELTGEIGGVRGELGQAESRLRGEIAELRVEMSERFHRQTVWLASTIVASSGAVIAAVPLLA